LNGYIRKPRIFEGLFDHLLEGGNAQLPIRISEVDLVFIDKEIGDRCMSDTNSFIGPLVSI